MEDWQVLTAVAAALGVNIAYASAAASARDIAAQFAGVHALDGIATLPFAKPVPAQHWLQASNPSERWKWDFMYQDLPPVKGGVRPLALPLPPGAIALKQSLGDRVRNGTIASANSNLRLQDRGRRGMRLLRGSLTRKSSVHEPRSGP